LIAASHATGILDYILPLVSPALISVRNEAGSTALHWAALNAHLGVMERLIKAPGGGGSGLIDIKNAAGRSPLAEAEMMGWDEGTSWLAQMMSLEGRSSPSEEQDSEPRTAVNVDPTQDIEVEIEDADGRVARMTLGAS
jgi:ankyrin repeat protein